MKKIITTLAFAVSVAVFAQDGLTSKKGEPILPEAGDWAVGIDATPFLDYLGNFFGKTNNNSAPTWDFQTLNSSIVGKYFKEANTAYRAGIRVGFGSNTVRNLVRDRSVAVTSSTIFPNQYPEKENSWKQSYRNIAISVGIEKRKGKTRLQGYYGGEVGLGLSGGKDKFTYGNSLAPTANPAVNVDPTDDAFTGSGNIASSVSIFQNGFGSARALEIKQGSTFSFGLRGFIGAEFFVLPKISLGGEFGWGLIFSSTGKTKTTWESVGRDESNNPVLVGTTTKETAKSGGFKLDTDNNNTIFGPAGSLRLILHF